MPKDTTILSEAISNYRKRSRTLHRVTVGSDQDSPNSSRVEASANRHSRQDVHKWWLIARLVGPCITTTRKWCNNTDLLNICRGLGAAIGAHFGYQATNTKNDLTVLVVGDGSFLFGVPASSYWIARRYGTPFLTIILNNGKRLPSSSDCYEES